MGETREAGRGLDALIAEKVMGYVWKRSAWTYGDPPRHARVLLPSRRAAAYMALQGDEGDCEAAESAPHFSADITAALPVAETLRAKGWNLTLGANHEDAGWWIVATHDAVEDAIDLSRTTMPLAICCVALDACEALRRAECERPIRRRRSSRGGEDA